MGEIVNLKQLRKSRERARREAEAEANRTRYGTSKAKRTLAKTSAEKTVRDLEAHKLDPEKDPGK